MTDDIWTCKGCGCTDDFGCETPCYWVEKDMCSNCVDADSITLKKAT